MTTPKQSTLALAEVLAKVQPPMTVFTEHHMLKLRSGVSHPNWPRGGHTVCERKEHKTGAKRGEHPHWTGWDELELLDFAYLCHCANQLPLLVAALEPFAKFASQYAKCPMSGIDDEFYAIHTGSEFEASLRHSDMRKALAALAAANAVPVP